MIVVRDVFQVKFGRMKEAKALWKEAPQNGGQRPRLLTDLVGPYYTLVLESTHKDLTDYEVTQRKMMSQPDTGGWYQKFAALVDSGKREIFTVVE